MKRARADSIISRLRATKSTREVDRPKAENKLPIWSAIGTKDVFKLELCAQILRDRFAVAQLTDFNPTASLFIIGPLATDSDIARTGEGLKVTHQFVLQTTRTGVVPDPIAYTWRQSPKAPTVVVPGPAATVAPVYAEGLTIFNANRRIARYFDAFSKLDTSAHTWDGGRHFSKANTFLMLRKPSFRSSKLILYSEHL